MVTYLAVNVENVETNVHLTFLRVHSIFYSNFIHKSVSIVTKKKPWIKKFSSIFSFQNVISSVKKFSGKMQKDTEKGIFNIFLDNFLYNSTWRKSN